MPTIEHLAKLESYKVLDNRSVEITCLTNENSRVLVVLEAYSRGVFRVRLFPSGVKTEDPQLALIEDEPKGSLKLFDEGDNLRIVEEEITAKIQKDPWRIEFYNLNGELVCGESISDLDVVARFKVSPVGFKREDGEIEEVWESLILRPDEHIYGFGEKFTWFDKRGQRFRLWNTEAGGNNTDKSYKNIPFFLSTKGYGVFIHTTRPIWVDIGRTSTATCNFKVEGPYLDYLLIYGPSLKRVLSKYTEITGRSPVPPKWSFGIWISSSCLELAFSNQEEVLEFCRKLRREGIPCDVIHLDPVWMRESMLCDLVWDKKKFPDPAEMIREMDKMGFKLCLWENPHISPKSERFKEAAKNGYLVKNEKGEVYIDKIINAAYVDFMNPEAYKWWKDLHKPLIEMGVKVFKCDFGEWIPEDGVLYGGRTGKEIHNYYPLPYQRAVWEALREIGKHERPVLWSRSGWATAQIRPVHWAGDSECTYQGMHGCLRGGLSIGLCGFTFWSHDLGGFGNKKQLRPSKDLYVRWLQFSTFTSHFRAHGTGRRDPWAYGEEAVRLFKKYAELRYRLMPYIYSCAHKSSETGMPMVKPLVLEYQDDPTTYTIDDEYIFGESFLVAPIFNSEGVRSIYLPRGVWVDFWNKMEYEGGRWIRYVAPLDIIPVFVKGDSIIPFGPVRQYIEVDPKPERDLTLDIYLYRAASFTLIDDYEKVEFKAMREANKITLYISKSNKEYTVLFNNVDKPYQAKIGAMRNRLEALRPASKRMATSNLNCYIRLKNDACGH